MPIQPVGNLRLILSRFVVVVAATLLIALILGCMSICVDRSQTINDDACWKQEGTFTLPGNQELDVFYPNSYVTPPNLTLKSTLDNCVVVSQFPDHFRVKNTSPFGWDVEWVAKGVRVPVPSSAPVAPDPAKGLPAEPVPVNDQQP